MPHQDSDKLETLVQEERIAAAQERTARAQEKAAKAQEKAAKTEYKLEKQRDRQDGSSLNVLKSLEKITGTKWQLIAVVAIIAIAVIAIGSAAFFFANQGRRSYLPASSLTKVVEIGKLAAAEIPYEGIAEKRDPEDSDKVLYRIRYKSTITASIDMSKIDFAVDQEKGIVTPILPEIEISNPVIDTKAQSKDDNGEENEATEDSISYLPESPNADLKEVISICKQDAKRDAGNDELLINTAKRNLETTIEALTKPLLDKSGYTIEWEASGSDKEGGNENK